jgi:hypothetical protein
VKRQFCRRSECDIIKMDLRKYIMTIWNGIELTTSSVRSAAICESSLPMQLRIY